jgi:hypothetical protein
VLVPILLTLLVCGFAVPTWWSAIRRGPLSDGLRRAVAALTLAAVIQLVFVAAVAQTRLDYSLGFAAIGVPCCALAAVVALKDNPKSPVAIRIGVGSLLMTGMWLFLITLH